MASQDRHKTSKSDIEQTSEGIAPNQPGGEEVLRVLSEFETGLDALRKLYAERQALQNRLREREDELVTRDAEIEEKGRELTELRERFNEQVHALETARTELEERELNLRARANQLDEVARANAESKRQTEEAKQAALQLVAQERAQTQREMEKVGEQSRELDKRAKVLAEQGRAIEQAEAQVAKARQDADAQHAALNELKRVLDEREKSVVLRERGLEEQQVQMQKQLATREQRIGELQQSIGDRERALESGRNQLQQREEQLQEARASLSQVESRRDGIEQALIEARTDIDTERANSQEARARCEAFERELANERQSLATLREQVARHAAAVEHESNRCEEQETRIAELRAELDDERDARLQAEKAAASVAQDLAAKYERELQNALKKSRDEMAEEFERAREQQRLAFAEERRQADRRSSERMGQAIAEASSASAAALEKRLREEMSEELQREIENVQAQMLAESQQRLNSEQKKWEAAAQQRMQQAIAQAVDQAAAQARVEASSQTQKEVSAKLHAQHTEQLAAQLALQAGQAAAQMEQRERDLRDLYEHELNLVRDQARKAIDDECERLDRETRARVEQVIADAQATTSQGETAVLEWQRQFESERTHRGTLVRELTGALQEYEQLWGVERSESAKLSTQIARLAGETGVEQGEQAFADLRMRLREDAEAKQELTEHLQTTEHQLSDAMSRVVALEIRLRSHNEDGGYVLGTWRTPESMERHRQRLLLARSMMRDQTDKIRKGSEALRKRFEQTERVLSQRAELAQARERVIDAERRVQSAAAKSKVAVVFLCITGSIGILGGLSYGLARELAPATFVATSVITADGRGRELNTAELAEWKTYHENILHDARFHQMAAERFQRVGIDTLSSASAAQQLAERSIDVQERAPGELILALAGEGATRTERVLDTLTAALVSHANAAQTARVDGSVTAVKQQAKSGTDPIDKTRLYWALGMLGAGIVVCGLAAIGLWRKLSGAKTKFESDTHLAAVLDQARWGDVNMPDLKDIERRTTKPNQPGDQKQAA